MKLLNKVYAKILRVLTNSSLNFNSNNKSPLSYIISDEKNSTFFGYHDRIPFSEDGKKLLALSYNEENKQINVGFFSFNNHKKKFLNFKKISSSNCWSTQQGNMLMWDFNDPNDTIIYNNYLNKQFCCEFYKISKAKKTKRLNFPFYSMSPNGRYLSSLNFSVLSKSRPGYGYSNKVFKGQSSNYLFIYDLINEKKIRFIDEDRLSVFIPKNFDGTVHLNHIAFSPDSEKVVFMQILKSNKKIINVFIYDIKLDKLSIIKNSFLISHYCWKNKNELILTMRDKFLRWRYYTYNIKQSKLIKLNLKIHTDGHPMVNPKNENLVVTDTSYRDKNDKLHLIVSDLKDYKVIKSIFHPKEFKFENRCDLHPRWNHYGDTICVDIYHNKERKMEIIDLSE